MRDHLREIKCPCGYTFHASLLHDGAEVACPPCGRVHGLATAGEGRRCPYCAEEIRPEAVKCRHCKELLHARKTVGRAAGDDGAGTLVLGILGLMLCTLLSPIAWHHGAKREREFRARGTTPPGNVTAGKILGIVGTVMMGFQILVVGIWLAAFFLTKS